MEPDEDTYFIAASKILTSSLFLFLPLQFSGTSSGFLPYPTTEKYL